MRDLKQKLNQEVVTYASCADSHDIGTRIFNKGATETTGSNMYIPRIIVGNCHFPHFPTWMGYVNDGRLVSTPYIGNGHPTFNDGNPRNGFV